MKLRDGYSKQSVKDNIELLMKEGYPQNQAVAIASESGRRAYLKRHPKGFPPWHLRTQAEKLRTGPASRNPAPRGVTINDAARLATRFHGRAPKDDEISTIKIPKLQKAATCIGDVFAIEYVAERDGKVNRFRHVFKTKSRPHLVINPDGKLALMLGGAWHFGDDGFEDH